jgi:hypothetical protein
MPDRILAWRFLAEPLEPGDLALLTGRLQLLHGNNAQPFMQQPSLLRPQPRNPQHLQQPGRHRRLQLLVVHQPSGGHQLGDLLLERFSKPLDRSEPPLGHQ